MIVKKKCSIFLAAIEFRQMTISFISRILFTNWWLQSNLAAVFLFPAIIPKEVSGQSIAEERTYLKGKSGLRFHFNNLRDLWGFLENFSIFRGVWRDFKRKNWEFLDRFFEHFSGFLCLGLVYTLAELCKNSCV